MPKIPELVKITEKRPKPANYWTRKAAGSLLPRKGDFLRPKGYRTIISFGKDHITLDDGRVVYLDMKYEKPTKKLIGQKIIEVGKDYLRLNYEPRLYVDDIELAE